MKTMSISEIKLIGIRSTSNIVRAGNLGKEKGGIPYCFFQDFIIFLFLQELLYSQHLRIKYYK